MSMGLFGGPAPSFQPQGQIMPQAGLAMSPGTAPSLGQTAAPGNIAAPGTPFNLGKTGDLASVFGQAAFGFDPANGLAAPSGYNGGGFNGGRQRVIR